MTTAAQASTVAILLCTHNGERFLPEQLDSFARQTHRAWVLWVSDDGSTDQTQNILEKHRVAWGQMGGQLGSQSARQSFGQSGGSYNARHHVDEKLNTVTGPRLGSTANFLSLVCHTDVRGDYFAYADQDDIWHDDKLARAVAWLDTVPKSTPALYCSRTNLIDEAGKALGMSRLFTKPARFENALVQNIGGGNTMVFNEAAREILMVAGPRANVVIHDWWTYLLVTGAGGVVFNDPTPSLQYRQHGGNQIGSNRGLAARAVRAAELIKGRFRAWTDINIAALRTIESHLTPQNRRVLQQFSAARTAPLIPRLIGVARSGIYRQTFIDNLGLYLAAALNRL